MKTKQVLIAFAIAVAPMGVAAAEKPRVFVTESQAVQASANASVGEVKGALALAGGTSPQRVEVIQAFSRECPQVVVTASREKADFTVRLDHEAINPTAPFVRGNKGVRQGPGFGLHQLDPAPERRGQGSLRGDGQAEEGRVGSGESPSHTLRAGVYLRRSASARESVFC